MARARRWRRRDQGIDVVVALAFLAGPPVS
jgi:hypothetical protein